jgi:hypothetical protein
MPPSSAAAGRPGRCAIGAFNAVADATFVDRGLARATAEILNAVLDGRLAKVEVP